MATNVVRRFEVPVASADTLDAEREVAKAVGGEVRPKINPVKRPPLLEVRLEGAASAVSKSMENLAKAGVRFQHDGINLRREGRNDAVYPDLHARVRVGADSIPPGVGAAPVTVAIVDSGLMFRHPVF